MKGINILIGQLEQDREILEQHFGGHQLDLLNQKIDTLHTFLKKIQDPASASLQVEWQPLTDLADALKQADANQKTVACRYNGLCVMMNSNDCDAVGGDSTGPDCNKTLIVPAPSVPQAP
jgi:hypothetical protein